MSDRADVKSLNGRFVTTRWTAVLRARGDSPEARVALGDLCAGYYEPVFAFIRREASSEDSARELTQEFFARLLAKQGLNTVREGRGRFRSFLLGAVKHFLRDMREHGRRLKRGGGQAMESLDEGTDTSPGLEVADNMALSPEQEFDRKWALTLLGRALSGLANEQAAAGKHEEFELLKPWLTGETGERSQAETAKLLGMNEGAVKVAIHRLRRRFRELVKAEIGQTLNEPDQVADELRCLTAAIRGG